MEWLDGVKIEASSCGNGLTTKSNVASGRQFELLVVKTLQVMKAQILNSTNSDNSAPVQICSLAFSAIASNPPVEERKVEKVEEVATVTKSELDQIILNLNKIEKAELDIKKLETEQAELDLTDNDQDDLISEAPTDEELELIGSYSCEVNDCKECAKKMRSLIKFKKQTNTITDRCDQCIGAKYSQYKRDKKAEKTQKLAERKEYLHSVTQTQYEAIQDSKRELARYDGTAVKTGDIDDATFQKIKEAKRSGIVNLNLVIRR